MSTHATADQPLEQCFPFPCGSTRPSNCCLLRMCFLGILGQTCLVTQELFPANVGRIHALLKSHPLFHRLAHPSLATSPRFAPPRVHGTPPQATAPCRTRVGQGPDQSRFPLPLSPAT